jgi:hypothetical protein
MRTKTILEVSHRLVPGLPVLDPNKNTAGFLILPGDRRRKIAVAEGCLCAQYWFNSGVPASADAEEPRRHNR